MKLEKDPGNIIPEKLNLNEKKEININKVEENRIEKNIKRAKVEREEFISKQPLHFP